MTTLDMYRSEEDSRRQWRRVSVHFTMRCKRLGRTDDEMVVKAVDLSPGGVRLHAPDRLMTGDIVLCWVDGGGDEFSVGLKGLVVRARSQDTRAGDVHVAWTNLSPESREELARLLTLHDFEREQAGTDASDQSRVSLGRDAGES